MEGPRGLRPDELEAVRALTGAVFRPSLVDEYPQLFNEDNYENLRVAFDGERCVSHVGTTRRAASLLGCQIRVTCVGAVSTLKEYRGQGLASACFDDAVAKAYEDGVDLMIVSGNRTLYRMRGCLVVGHDSRFNLSPESAAAVAQHVGLPVTVDTMTMAELPLVMACYRQEAVRYIRPLDDYRYTLQAHRAMDAPSEFLVIRERGEFRGYVLMGQARDGRAQLVEFAGDRRSLLAALPEIVNRYSLTGLHWQVLRHDELFQSLCTGAGLEATPVPTSGTVKLINFPQLMERMHPRFEELLGCADAAPLGFGQRDDGYVFHYGGDELVLDRDSATRLLFGTVAGDETAVLKGHGKLADVLRTILPLPCLWYGLNYV